MRVFGTFKNWRYLSKDNKFNIIANWTDVSDECGNSIGDKFTAKINNEILKEIKINNRYMIECDSINLNCIKSITSTKKVLKNKRCCIMRKAYGTFYFIQGKFKSINFDDIDPRELHDYTFWLAKNSNNEVTIKNCLEVLKKINNN